MLPNSPSLLYAPSKVPAAAAAALSLDGTQKTGNQASATSIVLPAFSTTKTNDIILIAGLSQGGAISSITGGTVTFAREPTLTPPFGSPNNLDLWWALASSIISAEAYTVNFAGGAAFCTALVFAVNGAHTAGPFSSSGPATTTAGTWATVTATEASNFGVGIAVNNASTPANSYTNLDATALSNFLLVNTKASSVSQSGVAFDTSSTGVSIATALFGP